MKPQYIGMEIGTKNVRSVLLDGDWNICLRKEVSASVSLGPDAVLRKMANLVREMTGEFNLAPKDLSAIGVGIPGPLNPKTGVLHAPPNLVGWERTPVGAKLAMLTGASVYIENDAKSAGWAEYVFGAGKGGANMVGVTVGSGVGGCFILNGSLFSGKDGMAGEIGHMPIDREGKRCICGSRGCVEAYVTPAAIIARFRNKISKGWRSSVSGKNDLTAQDIFLAANDGDVLSIKIVEQTGKYLGMMASALVNFLNPDRIVVSGQMVHFGNVLLESMRRECLSRCFAPNRSADILPSQLGRDAGVLGAAHLAFLRSGALRMGDQQPKKEEPTLN